MNQKNQSQKSTARNSNCSKLLMWEVSKFIRNQSEIRSSHEQELRKLLFDFLPSLCAMNTLKTEAWISLLNGIIKSLGNSKDFDYKAVIENVIKYLKI